MSDWNQIKGVVFGTAIGDALGYPREFALAGANPVTVQSTPSLFSDDTQMFRAVAEGLLRARTWTDLEAAAEEVAEEIIAWSRSPENTRAPGAACLQGAQRLSAGVSWRVAGKLDGGGCGAAMRSMAYGIWLDPDLAGRWAAEHALMTHRSPIGQASAGAVAAIVAALLAGAYPLDAVQQGREIAGHYDSVTADLLGQAIAYARIVTENAARGTAVDAEVLERWRGWAGHEAVAASAYCFLRYPWDFIEVMLLATNSSGDSDSLGAIAGAFSGGYLGATGIPDRWAEHIEDAAGLANLAARLAGAVIV